MQTFKVIYGKNKNPIGYLIRFFTWSRWQHVGIIDGDRVIEATMDKGVISIPLIDFKAKYAHTYIGEIPCVDSKVALDIANSKLGKKYDWLGIVGIVFRSRWEKDNRWFCSELVAYCTQLFRQERVSRVTPEHCFKITRDLDEIENTKS